MKEHHLKGDTCNNRIEKENLEFSKTKQSSNKKEAKNVKEKESPTLKECLVPKWIRIELRMKNTMMNAKLISTHFYHEKWLTLNLIKQLQQVKMKNKELQQAYNKQAQKGLQASITSVNTSG